MSASVWAIGDIHGKSDALAALTAALPRGEQDFTVYLGDYIDRGPDSAGVVAHVMGEADRAPGRTVLLWGNHEDLAAAHFGIPAPSVFEYDAEDWFRNGGRETMVSFACHPSGLSEAACPPELARLFPRLQRFWRPPIDRFPTLGHVVFVHAGLLPAQQPEDAPGEVLLWVRDEFLKEFDSSGRLVIHGHTPVKKIVPQADKIGIDTGAVYGGSLSALQLPERRVYQADAQGRVRSFDLPDPV